MQNNLAFVFPGQGSQTVGMLADFADNEVVQNTFLEASEALGYNLWELVAQGPAEKLNQTNFTQPALLTASVALWRLWASQSDIQPAMLAGHSLGEYSAPRPRYHSGAIPRWPRWEGQVDTIRNRDAE